MEAEVDEVVYSVLVRMVRGINRGWPGAEQHVGRLAKVREISIPLAAAPGVLDGREQKGRRSKNQSSCREL